MRKIIFVCLLTFLLSGCATTKEAIGDYVVDAVRDTVITEVDSLLERRFKLSVSEITSAIDNDNDGAVTHQEVYSTVRDLTRDYAMIEAKNYVDGQLENLRANTASKGDIQSTSDKFWQMLLGLLSMYLGKQLISQRGHSKRDQRLALLEKVIHKDLDGDGIIGSVTPTSVSPNNEIPADGGQVV